MKIWVNVTTEDGELLERFEVEVQDDKQYPLGSALAKLSILSDIESAARIVQARSENA